MATFAYATQRFTGHQGRVDCGASALDGNTLTYTVPSGTDNAIPTDVSFWAYKRILALFDSDDELRGIGYIGVRATNTTFTMDKLVDAEGNDCYFINHKGEAITPANTDYGLISGTPFDLAETAADWEQNGIDSLRFNKVIHVGTNAAEENGAVMYIEATQLQGTGITDKDTGYITMGGGLLVCGRLLDYQQNKVAFGVDFNVDNDTSRRFDFNTTANPSSGYCSRIMWFGGYFGTASQDLDTGYGNFWPAKNNTSGNQFRSAVWMGILSKVQIASANGGQPNVADSNSNGGTGDHILRGCIINYGGSYAPFSWFNESADNVIQVADKLGDGSAVRGFVAPYYNAPDDSIFEMGAFGNKHTEFWGRSADTPWRENECIVRFRQNGRDYGVIWRNINTPTRLPRYRDNHGLQLRSTQRFEYGGRWHNLASGTEVYRTYNDTIPAAAQTFGDLLTGDNFPDYDKLTVGASGQVDVFFNEAVYKPEAEAYSGNTYNYDDGYVELAGDSRHKYTNWTYSIKAYGYKEISIKPTRKKFPNAGREILLFDVAADATNSLGGGMPGGVEQERLEELWTAAGVLRLSEANAATYNAYFTAFTYASTRETDGSVKMTGATFSSTNADLDLTNWLAALHYETAAPADNDAGQEHRVAGFTITDGIIVFDADFTLTVAAANTTQVLYGAGNPDLVGVEINNKDFDLSLFSGDDLTMVSSGTNGKFINLPDNIPAWSLDGKYEHTAAGDKTFTFDAAAELEDFTFEYNGTDVITLKNAGSDITVTGSGTVNVVKEVAVTVTLGEAAATSKFRNIRWTSAASDTAGSFAGNNDDVDVSASGNDLTVTFTLPETHTNIWYAMAYDGYDLIVYKGTGLSREFMATTSTVSSVTFNNAASYFELNSDVDLADTTVAAIASDSADVSVTLTVSGGALATVFTDAKTRAWLRKYVVEADNYLEAVALDYVASNFISFGNSQIDVLHSDYTRLKFMKTANDDRVKSASRISSTTGTDLFESLSTTNARTFIGFTNNANGALPQEVRDIMIDELTNYAAAELSNGYTRDAAVEKLVEQSDDNLSTSKANNTILKVVQDNFLNTDSQVIQYLFEVDPDTSQIKGYGDDFGELVVGSNTLHIYGDLDGGSEMQVDAIYVQHNDSVNNFTIQSDEITSGNGFGVNVPTELAGGRILVSDQEGRHTELAFSDANIDNLEGTMTWTNQPTWLSNPNLESFHGFFTMVFFTTEFHDLAAKLVTLQTAVDAIKLKSDNLPASPAATGDIPTAAQNADAVLDEALSGHTTAGTLGKKIADLSNTDISGLATPSDIPTTSQIATAVSNELSVPTAADIADAVLDELLSGHTTSGSLGKAISDIASGSHDGAGPTADSIVTALLTKVFAASYDDNTVGKALKGVSTHTANDVRDALLDAHIDGTMELETALQIILAAVSGKITQTVDDDDVATVKIYAIDGTTLLATITDDADHNRTVTYA